MSKTIRFPCESNSTQFPPISLLLTIFNDKPYQMVGMAAGWASFTAYMYSLADGAIKALKQEIESLKSGGSEN